MQHRGPVLQRLMVGLVRVEHRSTGPVVVATVNARRRSNTRLPCVVGEALHLVAREYFGTSRRGDVLLDLDVHLADPDGAGF